MCDAAPPGANLDRQSCPILNLKCRRVRWSASAIVHLVDQTMPSACLDAVDQRRQHAFRPNLGCDPGGYGAGLARGPLHLAQCSGFPCKCPPPPESFEWARTRASAALPVPVRLRLLSTPPRRDASAVGYMWRDLTWVGLSPPGPATSPTHRLRIKSACRGLYRERGRWVLATYLNGYGIEHLPLPSRILKNRALRSSNMNL